MVECAYIHIPFCKSKCKYCSFISYSKEHLIESYVGALIKDIRSHYKGEELKTLYFGGGTPSLLDINSVSKIIDEFKFQKKYEMTIEINPDDSSFEYFRKLRSLGVNRLSIGSQTFDDKILKLIGRRHSSEDIVRSVNLAKKAGFENISLDLIYGLPYQNLDLLKSDLSRFIKLDIKHISTYGLKIDDNSFWGKYYDGDKGTLVYPDRSILLPDSDEQADMYEFINNYLEQNSFMRYEVSNFAKEGYYSRHNINYWDNAEYYGFGVAAHGYVSGCRYSNNVNIEDYIKNPTIHSNEKCLTFEEKLQEELFLGFRKVEGININLIKEKFDIDFEEKYKDVLEKYSDFFIKTNQSYTLTLKGVMLSNIILAEFI